MENKIYSVNYYYLLYKDTLYTFSYSATVKSQVYLNTTHVC